MLSAKRKRNRLNHKYQQEKQDEAAAQSEVQAWRKAQVQAHSDWQRLKPELDAAIKSANEVQAQVQAEVHKSQAPARKRVAELNQVLAQRQAAELAKAQEVLDAQKAQDLEDARQIEPADEVQRGLIRLELARARH